MSGDHISRVALQSRVDEIIKINHLRPDYVWFTPNGVKALAREIPAADVVEVVRCRDCKYREADYEMGRIMQNIWDPNTKPTEKRKLTIVIEFAPDDARSVIAVNVTAKSALAATTAIKTAIYASVGSFGEFSAVEMTPQVPGQMNLDGTEQEAAPVLRIAK